MNTQNKEEVVKLMQQIALVPVLRVPLPEQAALGVEGIHRAGLPIVEITLTIPDALSLISDLSERYGNRMLIGAGTVLDVTTCVAAISAGAKFIVSPGFNLAVVQVCNRHGIVCIPGALTPTEVLNAWEGGADVVKIFPCGLVGGAQYVRALKGPFPQIPLLPTGGVTLDGIGNFLSAGAAAVGVGEKIFDLEALKRGDLERIEANARSFMDAVQSWIKARQH